MADPIAIYVEWVDGAGNTTKAPAPYYWPRDVELPRIGDRLDWPIASPGRYTAEVVGRTWTMGSATDPALVITCDLGAYSGDLTGS